MDDFVPVIVVNKDTNKYERWYLDVSSLSLSELINLRGELIGSGVNSIRVLDGVIGSKYNVLVNDEYRNNYYYGKDSKEKKRNNKDYCRRKKSKCKERKIGEKLW